LLPHRGPVEPAARAGELPVLRAAVRRDVRVREAEVGQPRHVLHTRVGEVAAGELARALEQVPDERACRREAGVGDVTAEAVGEGGEEQ
jgi:hypothetical protein